MTEAEWVACGDPRQMLQSYREMRLDPRLRRFAVECCRRIRYLIAQDVFRAAADAGEAFADDPKNEKSTIKSMSIAASKAWRYRRRYSVQTDRHQLRAENAAIATCSHTDWNAAFNAMREAAQAMNATDADCCDLIELQHQANLLRDILGNPFHPSSPLPEGVLAWNDATVRRIVEGIYEERAFERLGILADALLDAGCEDEELIRHCRSEGQHVRGCWGVDLILGRS